ncbi:MAG: hypothetical protein HYU52_01710 [Acidobacteria bacterium]|nr:hypothetical protein [Acidobacteriota bacterium]
MQLLLYQLYSGQMFFSAALAIGATALLALAGALERSQIWRSIASVVALSAIGAAALCGVPMPLAQAFVVIPLTLAFALFGITAPKRRRVTLASLALLSTLASVALEIRWQRRTPFPMPRPARLIVLGDSLSSGGFGETTAWPELLARDSGATLVNLSLPGETAVSAAWNLLPDLPSAATGDVVIVALGGNDMLEGRPARDVEAALERILEASRAEGRRSIVMLELPVVPGKWRIGAIQRRLAKKHGVTLVPRRVIAKALLTPGCTFDGIHLTQRGHDLLAREIAHSLTW